ncbi:hypothetical protein BVRB_1g014800 [Beta vulgaris subsp. vulgaris]|nr:hypothetical protein BVRB_1g014800 [Beta vulgaris subsp. vulgaris]
MRNTRQTTKYRRPTNDEDVERRRRRSSDDEGVRANDEGIERTMKEERGE